jgi:hypothetical protein
MGRSDREQRGNGGRYTDTILVKASFIVKELKAQLPA